MKGNLKLECNGGSEEEQSTLEVLVSLPDKKVNVRKSRTLSCAYVMFISLFLYLFVLIENS